ncbi:winged helix-turn-helix domain-containing protein [Kluyvera intermedia]|uniref:winged helix-turn-helix domain-containing protein n=1 Tax=Kluyvera intermedia TaxID=61648 RepID=UPI001F19BCC0|nr:winged helix-turn-helix domain-containing protein [Kluyvera intermedia]EKU4733372.1 winged helix-turn-helix domain-containing protein [Kluyvera ascorbata]MCE9888434.1 winged helix-turn-helix domain-containing protein [Kluyvera intermedia]
MVFNQYIINDEVIFDANMNMLQPLGDKGEGVSLNAPTARCLQLLLESSNRVVSREEFLDSVWKTRGIVVSQNTFYQNISLLRKSLVKAGLSQDIIITVRQRGFVISSSVHISLFLKNDEVESDDIVNNKMMDSSSPIEYSAPQKSDLPADKNVSENINDKKIVTFMLPKWILPLFLAMLIANILSLFL